MMKKLYFEVVIIILFSFFPAFSQEKNSTQKSLDSLIQVYQQFQSEPYTVLKITDGEQLKSFGLFREADLALENQYLKKLKSSLEQLVDKQLNENDQINLTLLLYTITEKIAYFDNKDYLMPINAEGGFHTSFANSPNRSFSTVKDYEDYIARLSYFATYTNEYIAIMRKGIKEKITLPRVVLEGYEGTYNTHIVSDISQSTFFKPFEKFPVHFSNEIKEKLIAEGKKAIQESVIKGYKAFGEFIEKEYLPSARTTVGVSALPNGKAYYQSRANHFTTLNISVQEIHEIGLKEVARIKQEMQEVMKQAKFEGDFKAFLEFLRTSPQFYVETPEQLLKEASFLAKKADGKLPAFFGKLPRQPYGVEPVPDLIAPKYTGGRYVPAPLNGKRGGTYWVNTYNLKSRPLYILESLTLHEAVPGHHLQIALTKELNHLPPFRQNLYISAFGEGWGLYCEWLGIEMGFYQNPYTNFGRLTYEMWRACRLVVDTGIHALGWSREQAINYLAENTALSLHEVRTEIDRYIGWAGQALSYKIGELKIKELRKKAEAELKEKFDIREFHDTLLSQGTVTLPIMEKIVNKYIQSKKQ
ncbi:DUF885 domain-containing protein [Thermoflexibacter ruber]|uniref:Uncharacterized conserved protein, DUF885 familyt n=1 Tax=Thermoflexibacter ruber TaxID=1003 RepID=A0A1I2K6W8_9BACT|nr:DUF885 domain-containing protein [Thermoflexibacter ruber]SFF60821.1 Uncharacterized conserved protein, DUF885 familyt [Thermoflexibacter ruber]